MYNPLLDTFITVIDCGSFTRAAEHLFISPTAVMKQMNSLEDHLKLKLIKRSSTGIELTAAGKIIYENSKLIKKSSEKYIAEAIAATHTYDTTFCVGTSLLNPAKPFMDLWYLVNDSFKDYKLHLVTFEDNHDGILSEIDGLGEKFDFLIGVCDSKKWLSRCNFLELGTYKKMIAVPRKHPLASKECVALSDLYGQNLMMIPRGDSPTNDKIRKFLEQNHPQIVITDTQPFYDMRVFNQCAESDNILLSIECWKDVHPGLVTIPVEWDFEIPYGILYAQNPPDDVQEFIETVKNLKSTDDHLHNI